MSFTAKFAGKCSRCGGRINTGEQGARRLPARHLPRRRTTSTSTASGRSRSTRFFRFRGERIVRAEAEQAQPPERVKCSRCAGTGRFITYVENGVPKGPGGDCFRCGGKGYQTERDERRNWGYDNFYMRVSF